MTTLIIADSRGRGLSELLANTKSPDQISLLTYPGAGSELAVLKSLKYISDFNPHLVIMLTGVCDLTWRNKSTKQISLRFEKLNEIISHVLDALHTAYDLLTAHGVPKISFATITGVDLSDCNYPPRKHMTTEQYIDYCATTKISHPDQSKLNDAILQINRKIVTLNRRNSAKTTWIAGLVHSYYKNKYHHCYKRLFDGCHPDQKTKKAWAGQIIKSLNRILATHPST